MQANRRGNPRTPRGGNFGQNRRSSQGAATGPAPTAQQPNWHFGFRNNRTSSTSSDQSNSTNPNFGNRRGNDRRNFSSGNSFQGHRRNYSEDRRQDSRNHPNRKYHFGFKALADLLEKDPEGIIMELSNANRGIIEYIQSNSSEDAIVLFVKILKKVSDSSFDENKYKVLQKCLDQDFVKKLVSYILHLSLQDDERQRRNRYFWNDPDEFWNNIISLCQHLFDSLPTFSRSVVPDILKSLIVTFPSFEMQHSRHISDEIKEKLTKLNEAVKEAIQQFEEKQKESAERKLRYEDLEEPPDDFRMISVYPTPVELGAGMKPFLRKNVVDGPYKDVNHYLDVQFRLLREDFVGPLRSAIATFRSNRENRSKDKKKVENVRIHKAVRFMNPETVNEQYCMRLRFDSSKKKKNFKYENSKRFMFGSLLVFTSDNFQTFIFGKVAERKLEDLEKGEVIVGFDQSTVVYYQTDYLMVECTIFFEPYYHVLNVLQKMSLDNFPMEKYIINVDASVQPPQYLTPGTAYTVRGYEFNPLLNWPAINFYQLNPSQRQAFKAALTQEFCIIQGPPGTGKTFLGLKIAKTLLQNSEIWFKNTPMLVICYTNHALDQFLEGLIPCTQNILRVGGQSKNEALKGFNLRNKGKFRMNAAFFQARDEVQGILSDIKDVTENLKLIDLCNSIRNFDVFADVVKDFNKSWFVKAKKDEILEWLLGAPPSDKQTVPVTPQIDEVAGGVARLSVYDEEEDSEESDDEVLDEDDNVELDDLFEQVRAIEVQCSFPLVTLSSIASKISHFDAKLNQLRQNQNPTFEDYVQEAVFSAELEKFQFQYHYLNDVLGEAKRRANMKKEAPDFIDLTNPHAMPPKARWDLYFYWLDLYKDKLREKLDLLNRQFRVSYKIYEEMRDIENTRQMKEALVIGMTTTGAARLRSSLQALKSPIVIVEEAAEVLEAHIVSSLTKHCQHLILIGDHQQLKPSTANYSVEKFYNLGISLFERMVLNKIQLFTLNVQHRMRPEISSLISPTIYPDLEDHESVKERPMIRGVDNCLFFLDHQHEEDNCEGTSKKNYHEVEFLINYARHLILNGYKAENITILAAYLGQMYEMFKERRKHKEILENVRIAVLDNYQGEECDIILLSLVRNNQENRIGFLKIENRVCVALSRARNGFYIMGNMTQLCAESELWKTIRRTLENQNSLGTELPLRCQVHTDRVTYVKKGDDFLAISEGGCSQKCGADLICGHKCTSLCHILDREHKNYKCRETCNKKLCDTNPLHICKKTCYSECGPCYYPVQRTLPCGHIVNLECHIDPDVHKCTVPVSTTLPCGHVTDKPCHCDAATFRCPHPCEVKVEPCGHACRFTCHIRRDPDHLEYKCTKRCARYSTGCTTKTEQHLCPKLCYEECEPCTILVKKRRTVCPHVYNVPCSSDVDELVCEKPCTKILACGHKCKSKCREECRKCEIKVDKINPICGHAIKVKCCEEPDRKLCKQKCPLMLPCGHPCTKKCNEPCTEICKEMVNCLKLSPCGHTITKVKCSVANSREGNPKLLLKYCNQACGAQLKCGHTCSGSCGECHQGRIHKTCSAKCGFPLVCNHPCEFPCRQACRPCARPCPYKCKHSSCSKRCGDVCTPCREKCTRRCRHQQCTKFCGEICSVPPCTEPCNEKLICGHLCIGFCGDPCPEKCLVCDREELTEIFFGFEEDEGARFVLLEDCGHIFESEGFEGWINQDDGKIRFKECPRCKTPIKTTQRYSDSIKRAMDSVSKVKEKCYGANKDNSDKRLNLQLQLEGLKMKGRHLATCCPKFDSLIQILKKRLELDRKGKRQQINKAELSSIESKLQILDHILKIIKDLETTAYLEEGPHSNQLNFLLEILLRHEDYITDQEIGDIQFELNRLSRIVDFRKIKNSPSFSYYSSTNPKIKNFREQIEKLLFSMEKFYDEDEDQVRRLLGELNKLVAAGVGITEKERREIVQAIGLRQGHWYKCRNGHPYAIGECGGAMQQAKCPCGAPIGGMSHQLLSDNAVATEMDGARYGAWSEQANMANYQLRFE